MDENEVAELMARVMQWNVDRASSPAMIEFVYEGENTFTLVAVPGNKMRVTVEAID